ncbi:hypothetical protein PF002_g517 [Phytophthora fragariae]|uniref:DUF6570 domain-containing protein n=1 Tax=Phytophthora fragariae TaxID=53985 RepID=A0A6A4AFM3_9STRA|nr:hypothetical protein PF002_g517 [Phytophthora fragariae]
MQRSVSTGDVVASWSSTRRVVSSVSSALAFSMPHVHRSVPSCSMWPTLDGKSSVSSGIERATASRIDGEPSGSVRPTSTPSTASRAPARGRRCTSSAATPMRVDVRQSVLSSVRSLPFALLRRTCARAANGSCGRRTMSRSAIASSSMRAAMCAAKDASTGRYATNASSSGVRAAYNAPIGRCNSARPSRLVTLIAADEALVLSRLKQSTLSNSSESTSERSSARARPASVPSLRETMPFTAEERRERNRLAVQRMRARESTDGKAERLRQQRERRRQSAQRLRDRASLAATEERLRRDREWHERARAPERRAPEPQQQAARHRVWGESDIARLQPVSIDAKRECLERLQLALGGAGLDEITCAVCDSLKLATSCRVIKATDGNRVRQLRELLSSAGEALPAKLIAEYDCSSRSPVLAGLLLPKRGVHADGRIHVCTDCDKSLTKHLVPKFAIKNGFAIGSLPPGLADATLPERLITQPVSVVAVTRVMRGGAHRSIRSHCLAFDCTPGPTTTLQPIQPDRISTYRVVMAGPFTSEQQARVRKMHRIRRQVVDDLLRFYKQHNPLYASVSIADSSHLSTDGVAENVIFEDPDANAEVGDIDVENDRVGGVSENDACAAESDVVERRVVFVSDDCEVTTQHARVATSPSVEPQFLVRHSTQFATKDKDLYARMLPHLFPYGRWHPGDERHVHVSRDSCIRHYSQLSSRRFAEDELFMVASFDHLSAEKLFTNVAVKLQRDPARFASYSDVTEHALLNALPTKERRRHGLELEDAVQLEARHRGGVRAAKAAIYRRDLCLSTREHEGADCDEYGEYLRGLSRTRFRVEHREDDAFRQDHVARALMMLPPSPDDARWSARCIAFAVSMLVFMLNLHWWSHAGSCFKKSSTAAPGQCRYNFPRARAACTSCTSDGVTLARRAPFEFVNGFNTEIMLAFKSNHDIQVMIGGLSALRIFYATKYVTKMQEHIDSITAVALAAIRRRQLREARNEEAVANTDRATIGRRRVASLLYAITNRREIAGTLSALYVQRGSCTFMSTPCATFHLRAILNEFIDQDAHSCDLVELRGCDSSVTFREASFLDDYSYRPP